MRPPCWHKDTEPNPCAQALYAATVHNHTDLHGPWTGWKLRGRDMVSPDGERISPERLRGLLWRERKEERLARAIARRQAEHDRRERQPVKVIVVELGSLRHQGEAAG